jgi:hypothetical protein
MRLKHGPTIEDEWEDEDEWDDESDKQTDKSWLDELGPAHTATLDNRAAHDEEQSDVTSALPDVPDWLTDIGPAHTAQLEPTETSDSDWLDELDPAYTGPLADEDEPFDLDEFAFTGSLSDLDESETGPLPDWLANLEPAAIDEEDDWDDDEWDDEDKKEDEGLGKWITWQGEADEGEDEEEGEEIESWNAWEDEEDDEDQDQEAEEDTKWDIWDDEDDKSDTFLDDDIDDDDTAEEIAGDSDWLTALSALPPEELIEESPTTPGAGLDDTIDGGLDELIDDEEVYPVETADPFTSLPHDESEVQDQPFLEPEAEITTDQDQPDEDDLFDLEALPADEEIPEWVSQLGPPTAGDTGPLDQPPPEDLARNEDLPEWLTNMMPTDEEAGATLSDMALKDSDFIDPLEGIPEELAGAELPDWLHDAPPPRKTGQTGRLPAQPEMRDVPDWLKQSPEETEESAKMSAELSDLLGPPVRDPAAGLSRANIPDWLQALKPTELSGKTPEPAAPTATSGPLSGVQGVLAIEPIIAQPRTATSNYAPFTVSKEQREQVKLLEQIVAAEGEAQPVANMKQQPAMARATQLLLALLLLVAVIVGLWGPTLFVANNPTPAVVDLHTAVEAAAGQPVLLVFDYTPALAGELTPQAAALLQQLAANNSPVVSLSQYTAGERLADLQTAVSHSDNRHHIGYLPGDAIGIRQLGYCLANTATCDALIGRSLSPQQIQVLSDVVLVIILTGERDNLVNWIEQLAMYDNLTLAAGVTQSLRPVAAPYLATGQLAGLLSGLNDTITYQESLLGQPAPAPLAQQQNAQGMAQLVAALLLLAGLFIYARRR